MSDGQAWRWLEWLDGYETAWRTPGTALLADLFTPDAVYLRTPYADPVVGLAGIGRLWERDRQGPDEVFTLTHELVATTGRIGVVRCLVRYGDPLEPEYTDLWVVDLDEDGRCTRFEEWPFWPQSPRSAPSARD